MIRIFESAEEMRLTAAWSFIKRALMPDTALIGVATGDTTAGIYRRVAEVYGAAPFATDALAICCLDDYVGIPEGHIASCAERVRRQIVRPLNLKPEQALFIGGYETVEEYEEAIRVRGGMRTLYLGVGADGHLGFCRPGTPFGSMAHEVTLPADTKAMLTRKYSLPASDLPEKGRTLGIKSMMNVPELIVAANGAEKAAAVAAAIKGPVSESAPASVLQLHPNVTWLLDREAASLL